MVNRDIFVKSIEERTSKATGKVFWTVDTSEGKMSVWDVEIEKEIKKATLPTTLILEVQEKGNFKNIVGITMETSFQRPSYLKPIRTGLANPSARTTFQVP